MASPFVKAMDDAAIPSKTLGENGAPEYTADGVGDPRVALFSALVRDLPSDQLKKLLDKVLDLDDAQATADAFVLAFQTRNCRGGKGERHLFHCMIMCLSTRYPETTRALMKLVPHYGSFKDWFHIAKMTMSCPELAVKVAMEKVLEEITELAVSQLREDKYRVDEAEAKKKDDDPSKQDDVSISLLAKWAPREKGEYSDQVKILASRLFPTSSAPKRDYRKLVVSLNAALATVEVKMSSNDWDEIDFGKNVPSRALMKYRKAFLNEKLKGPMVMDEETGNRHPDDAKRVACRKRLRNELLNQEASKLKGKQLFPHEVVSKLLPYGCRSYGVYGSYGQKVSLLEAEVLDAQWRDIRRSVQESMEKMRATASEGADVDEADQSSKIAKIDLGKLVGLVDVSGSMWGQPMEVAVALGVLVSELASPAFANRFITFSSKPEWVVFGKEQTIGEKVSTLSSAHWSVNTDFEAATELILEVAQSARLEPEDIPSLIVFSDMQFDEARRNGGGWETYQERIERRFRETGVKVCGTPWPAPHIVYWNLRGGTTGFVAQANTPGVTMLSGFSPALLKLLLAGEELEEEEAVMVDQDGEVVVKKKRKTPYMTLRAALDDKDYDKVRLVLNGSTEGLLSTYKFEPEPAVNTEGSAKTGEEEWVMA